MKIIQKTGLCQTSLQLTGTKFKLSQQKEIVLFRIVQESLHNALKHAKPKNIGVELSYDPAQFKMLITDDGEGFDLAQLKTADTGIGLKNMQDRATLIGGNFVLKAAPGEGTAIAVTISNPET